MEMFSFAHKRMRLDDLSDSPPTTRPIEMDEESVSVERVAPDGDVIFVLSEGVDKIQVQSSIMKNASPVFSAMLAGHFREGQMLQEAAASGQPVEIPLPGDNFDAFKLMCVALHRQADTKQCLPTVRELMRVLEIADKYNLIDSVSLSMEFWARGFVSDPNFNHFVLMMICHHIRSQDLFQLFSRSLVLNHRGSFLTLAAKNEPNVCDAVPRATIYKLACALEEMRATMTRRITKLINAEMMVRFKNGLSDKAMSSNLLPYYRLLRGVLDSYSRSPGLHSVGNNYSVNDVTVQIMRIETSFTVDDGNSVNVPPLNALYMALLRRLRGLNEIFLGLCLYCLESEKPNFDCRGIHG